MIKFILFLLFAGLVALGVYYHQEVQDVSQAFIVSREAKKSARSGRIDDVLLVYEKGLKDNPTNPHLQNRLAAIYLANNQPDKAKQLYDDALKLNPKNVNALLGSARILMQDKEHPNRALFALKQVLQITQSNPMVFDHLGEVYHQTANHIDGEHPRLQRWLYQWAEYYYRIAIEVNPKRFFPWFQLGQVYYQLTEFEKASTAYCNALLINPNSPEARYDFGLSVARLGELDESQQQFGRAQQILEDQNKIDHAQAMAQEIQYSKDTLFEELKRPVTPTDWSHLNKACLIGG